MPPTATTIKILFVFIITIQTLFGGSDRNCGSTCKCDSKDCKDHTVTCNKPTCDITCSSSTKESCEKTKFDGSKTVDMTVKCPYEESCKDAKTTCGSGACNIKCGTNKDKDEACDGMTVKGGNGPLTMTCTGDEYACKKAKITCGAGGCDIICDDSDEYACKETNINCGSGDCNVQCIGHKHSCESMVLNCGDSSSCNIECKSSSYHPCKKITVNLDNAAAFSCSGPNEQYHCDYDNNVVPSPFSAPFPLQTYAEAGDGKVILPTICRSTDGGCTLLNEKSYGLRTWEDDLKYNTNGKGGWNESPDLREIAQGTNTGITPLTVDGTDYAIYHGDYSGPNYYAQGTVNSFFRYFECPFEAFVQVEFDVRFCGTEPEDKIFLEFNGIQLGQEMNLGCDPNTRKRPGDFDANYDDSTIKRVCPGGGNGGGNCKNGQYKNVGQLSFDETSAEPLNAFTAFQVQFFWRYSHSSDHIFIYNIALTCVPTDRGESTLHASQGTDLVWPVDVDAPPDSKPKVWRTNPNWEIQTDACQELIDGLPDTSFSATGSRGDGFAPAKAKKSSSIREAWCGPDAIPNGNDYLQINLGTTKQIGHIRTWGREGSRDWVTEFQLQYSNDGTSFTTYDSPLLINTFDGNTNAHTAKTNIISNPFDAQYLRFVPTTANTWPCMRVEAFPADYDPLIQPLSDESFSENPTDVDKQCSSCGPQYAKKDSGNAWCTVASPDGANDYLQIDLGTVKDIQYIRTWGRGGQTQDYIKSFDFTYSVDGTTWEPNIFGNVFPIRIQGNSDSQSTNQQQTASVISAKYLRFTPITYSGKPCMRVEVYPPFWNELCLDDDEPKYFHDGYVVSFQGRFRWKNPGVNNLMGSKDKGLIGVISEVDARPRYDELFSVVQEDGVTLSIEIETDGKIYLRQWSTPYSIYKPGTPNNNKLITYEQQLSIVDDAGEDPPYAVQQSKLEAADVAGADIIDDNIFASDLHDIIECSVDGIVYISINAWAAADPHNHAANVIPDIHKNIDNEPDNHGPIEPSEPITNVIRTPKDMFWNVSVNDIILDICVFIIVVTLVFMVCCRNVNGSKYSKVKTYSYNDTVSESDVV